MAASAAQCGVGLASAYSARGGWMIKALRVQRVVRDSRLPAREAAGSGASEHLARRASAARRSDASFGCVAPCMGAAGMMNGRSRRNGLLESDQRNCLHSWACSGGLFAWERPAAAGAGFPRSMGGSAQEAQGDQRGGESRKASSEAKLPTMEAHLRKLYMRVHPDLFSSHPEAREENERSFQMLSEFLSVLKGQDQGRGGKGKVFKLTFHMRPEAEPGQGGGVGAVEAELEQVTVSLRADGSPRDKKKQLKKLFEACGISGDFAYTAAPGGNSGGRASSQPASDFEAFVREQSQAAAAARQEHDRAWRKLYATQHALQLWHQVRVSFGGECATWTPDARAELLDHLLSEQVVKLLNREPNEEAIGRASSHLLLADANTIQADGRVTLDARDPGSWARHLSTMDWTMAYQAADGIKRIRDLERAAAQCLGLAFVHGATASLEQSRAYESMLEVICKRCKDTHFAGHVQRRAPGDESGALMQRPVLLVQTDLDLDDGSSKIPHFDGCALETARGTLLAAVTAPPENVLSLVLTHGQEAAECRARLDTQHKALTMLMGEAKSCLGLTSLEVDWHAGVEHDQVLACCAKLIAASGSLMPPRGLAPLTQGLHLCIGLHYGVRDDGAMILPHDIDLGAA